MFGSVQSNRFSISLRDPRSRAETIAVITKAFQTAGGTATGAALELEVSLRSLQRWLSEYPDLAAAVKKVREEHGVAHEVGSATRAKGLEPGSRASKELAKKKAVTRIRKKVTTG